MGSLGIPSQEFTHPLISERAIDEPRPLKVIHVGAGASGICAAIQFPRHVPNLELVIYEKNPDVGGTWFENRYPGCACDIPAHSYQLSYESKVTWSKFYASVPEILEYWKRVVEKHNVRRLMRFGHECVEARWDEEACKWHVKFKILATGHITEDVADVFVTGIGVLNRWEWPDIKGLHQFEGKLLHSANWDPDYDPTGRRVAVIGAGSSGIQIVPALQPLVKSMDHYIKGRTWIAASFANELVRERNEGEDGNFDHDPKEIEAWKRDPRSYLAYRKALEVGMQGGFAITHRGSKEHEAAWAAFTKDMRRRLHKKSEVADRLVPVPPLCKRLTPGPGYLEALVADNVNVILDRISHVDATAITTVDGTHRAVDAIITATGFNTSFRGGFPIYGRGGLRLQERNATRAETYLGVAVDRFPNFLHALGPNSGLGNGNLVLVIESVADYIGQVLEKLSKGNVKTIEPKRECVENFTNYCDAFFQRTVFSAECGSWYKSANGRVTALWPGSSIHAARALQKVRFEDYVMTTADVNDFGWIGDGWSVAERTGDVDGLSWYLNGTNFLHEPLKVDAD
ncbi:hypothetical protein B0A54_17554 [Friedmanniomyces endolithicus]|uniref:Sterigmatocystin biosynthesis monooxygenase stcW n=1 Tax=Friedmanniomyces endolithicus TaxID=329885 RepID=A0A4U0TRM3_9PEZI|nr:hypothetical protein B0A54_17554 [Friedmanniomyces endolithicus]